MDVATEILEAVGLVYCGENGVDDVDSCRKRSLQLRTLQYSKGSGRTCWSVEVPLD